MRGRSIGAALVAGFAIMTASQVSAQQRQTPRAQPSVMEDDEDDQPAPPPKSAPTRHSRAQSAAPAPQPDPNLNTEDQLAPSQMKQPMPSAVAEPNSGSGRKAAHPATHAAAGAETEPPAAKPARPGIGRTVVACSGPFAKDSSMLGLAMAFDSRNVIFTEIDAAGTKVGASVLFPKDPKRRLEVWWSNPGNRSGTYLIVINGKSTWSAPDGMRLGLTLAQLEKLNRKSFKLKGFDKNRVATISDWDGGLLASLPGGCKSGLSLTAGPKASANAVSAMRADQEYKSSNPAMRAVKPTVSEILIGY